ncbi:TPA: hypothetical protein HA265_07825 [Candidatus Woesearchaeota archaeon]|nr:hypothetical protein [Candidatus Woesearchaeota archaeon]
MHELVNVGVDLVLSGHKHTPYAWFLNKMALVTAGSVSSKKLRADIENSYNIIDINSTHIDVFVKPIGGTKRPLARYQKRDSEEYKLCLP